VSKNKQHKLRSVNVHFWDDNYVISLRPKEKLLFLYLLTNGLCNLIGVYEITLSRISFDTGLTRREVSSYLDKFEKDNKLLFKSGYVILVNFIKNQSFNPNMILGAGTLWQALPNPLQTVLNALPQFEIIKQTLPEVEVEVEKEVEYNMKLKLNGKPSLSEVKTLFENEGFDEYEAVKFFEHNKATKWLNDGKPVDWLFCARKWIEQIKKSAIKFKSH